MNLGGFFRRLAGRRSNGQPIEPARLALAPTPELGQNGGSKGPNGGSKGQSATHFAPRSDESDPAGNGLQGGQIGVAAGRVSPTKEQRDQWRAERQDAELRTQAERHGIHLVDCGIDIAAFDAPLERRAALLKAIHTIEERRATWLVLRDYERLGGPSLQAQEDVLARVFDAGGRILLEEGEITRTAPDGDWRRRQARHRAYNDALEARYALRRARERGLLLAREREPNIYLGGGGPSKWMFRLRPRHDPRSQPARRERPAAGGDPADV